jgi:hypothetical protein
MPQVNCMHWLVLYVTVLSVTETAQRRITK